MIVPTVVYYIYYCIGISTVFVIVSAVLCISMIRLVLLKRD